MVRIQTKINPGRLQRVSQALYPSRIDAVVERVALKAYRDTVDATPVRWFGQVRKSWELIKPSPGARLIINRNKVMLFLEEGTQDHGPKTARAMFLPLVREAAFGYRTGMK